MGEWAIAPTFNQRLSEPAPSVTAATFVLSQGRLDITFNSPVASLPTFNAAEWQAQTSDARDWGGPTGWTVTGGGVLRVTGFEGVSSLANLNRFRRVGGSPITLANTTQVGSIDWTAMSTV